MRPLTAALLLLLAALVSARAPTAAQAAERIARVEARVQAAPTLAAAADAVPDEIFDTASMQAILTRMRAGDKAAKAEALNSLAAFRLSAELTADRDAVEIAKRVKTAPEYRTAPAGSGANWLSRAVRGFLDWLAKLLRRTNPDAPNLNIPKLALPGWLVYVVWALLAAAVVAGAIPLIRLIRFRVARRARRRKGIIEDEPERTKAEYLNLGDDLAARGDFRAAIRMRYLASLKRFDEARVARFDRGETNWEHLARIRASATRPKELDFTPATAAFDHFWYGFRPAARPDYDRFVAWYDEVDRALAGLGSL